MICGNGNQSKLNQTIKPVWKTNIPVLPSLSAGDELIWTCVCPHTLSVQCAICFASSLMTGNPWHQQSNLTIVMIIRYKWKVFKTRGWPLRCLFILQLIRCFFFNQCVPRMTSEKQKSTCKNDNWVKKYPYNLKLKELDLHTRHTETQALFHCLSA